jgi:NAD(P)-dependent dehydrogenase (short-subunit alcohol dehydrogenase family)
MKLKNTHIIVTGAAGGIGAALARRFAAEGARGVVVADVAATRDTLEALARDIGGLAVPCDVSREADIKALVVAAKARFGPVDVFFSNAGISRKGHEDALDADWEDSWRVHVMSHVFACRAVVPDMLARGSGYLVSTASAAGLLASMGSAPYGVTKHAAVALAEHLAIQYGDRGIRVSVLCPQAVDTPMYRGAGTQAAGVDGIASPQDVAERVVAAMDKETFLILSHPEVVEYMKRKAADPDRWLTGMRRLLGKLHSGAVKG